MRVFTCLIFLLSASDTLQAFDWKSLLCWPCLHHEDLDISEAVEAEPESESSDLSPFESLPDELVLIIFDELSQIDRVRSARVCRRWHMLCPTAGAMPVTQILSLSFDTAAPLVQDLSLKATMALIRHWTDVLVQEQTSWLGGFVQELQLDALSKGHGVCEVYEAAFDTIAAVFWGGSLLLT